VSLVLVGQLLTRDGLSSRSELAADCWSIRQRSWASPASALRKVQPSRIPLDIEHDHQAEVGQVVALYRSGSGDCWAVATSEADRLADYDQPLYFSAQFRPRFDADNLVLEAVAVTEQSATVAKRPVEMFRGSLERSWERSRWNLGGLSLRLVEHAARGLRERSSGNALLVYDELAAGEVPLRVRGGFIVGGDFVAVDARVPPAAVNRHPADDLPPEDERPPGKLRWRPSTILAVR
jgi:hypothetical protein